MSNQLRRESERPQKNQENQTMDEESGEGHLSLPRSGSRGFRACVYDGGCQNHRRGPVMECSQWRQTQETRGKLNPCMTRPRTCHNGNLGTKSRGSAAVHDLRTTHVFIVAVPSDFPSASHRLQCRFPDGSS